MSNPKLSVWEKELTERLGEIKLTKGRLRTQLSNWETPDDQDRARWIADMTQITTGPMFFGAQTWEDICALYEIYFKGYLPAVPTQASPLDLEYTFQTDHLASLARLGVIPIRTQIGNCDSEERERAYIEGYVNTKQIDIENLFTALSKRSLLVTLLTHSASSNDISNVSETLLNWRPLTEQYATNSLTSSSMRYAAQAPHNEEYLKGAIQRIPLKVNSDDLQRRWWIPQSTVADIAMTRESFFGPWRRIEDASPSLASTIIDDLVFIRILHGNFCKSDLLASVKTAVKESQLIQSSLRSRLNNFNPLRRSFGGKRRSRTTRTIQQKRKSQQKCKSKSKRRRQSNHFSSK